MKNRYFGFLFIFLLSTFFNAMQAADVPRIPAERKPAAARNLMMLRMLQIFSVGAWVGTIGTGIYSMITFPECGPYWHFGNDQAKLLLMYHKAGNHIPSEIQARLGIVATPTDIAFGDEAFVFAYQRKSIDIFKDFLKTVSMQEARHFLLNKAFNNSQYIDVLAYLTRHIDVNSPGNGLKPLLLPTSLATIAIFGFIYGPKILGFINKYCKKFADAENFMHENYNHTEGILNLASFFAGVATPALIVWKYFK